MLMLRVLEHSMSLTGTVIIEFITVCVLLQVCRCQLIVNIRNGGGDVVVESIHANTTDDSIELKFTTTDGTQSTQLIDFNNEVQIFRVYILGEEELGQSHYRCMCFIKRFMHNEFISSDAMSKLRQKNPTAIRVPEEDVGQEVKVMDLAVSLEKGHVISPHVTEFCKDAPQSTYTNENDINVLSTSIAKDLNTLMSATRHLHPKQPDPRTTEHRAEYKRCSEHTSLSLPCVCRYEICINWYPCGLKYCHGKDSSGRLVSYRCGIKTCRKCRVFDHLVSGKSLCMWDQP